MRYKFQNIILSLSAILVVSCSQDTEKSYRNNPDLHLHSDTSRQEATHFTKPGNDAEKTVNDHLADRLKPIQLNLKRIGSIRKWTSIISKDLQGSAEGGEVNYYFQNDTLEKIMTRYFGETGQRVTEYYLLNGALSFVYERLYIYNRPFSYDSLAMKENKDHEAFSPKKSEIIETRNYFERGRLIHEAGKKDSDAVSLKEVQERILIDFKALLEMIKK